MNVTVSREDLVEFIKKQPPDKQVDFTQSLAYNKDECGCLFVEYVKSVEPDFDLIECGIFSAYVYKNRKRIREYTFSHTFALFGTPNTFGALQQNIQS